MRSNRSVPPCPVIPSFNTPFRAWQWNGFARRSVLPFDCAVPITEFRCAPERAALRSARDIGRPLGWHPHTVPSFQPPESFQASQISFEGSRPGTAAVLRIIDFEVMRIGLDVGPNLALKDGAALMDSR